MVVQNQTFVLFSIIIIIFVSFTIPCSICLSDLQDLDGNPSHSNNLFDEAKTRSLFLNTIKNEDGKLFKLRARFMRSRKLGDVSPPMEVGNAFNVDDYGAEGDGSTDDSKAFLKAWKAACAYKRAVLVVPEEKTYLLKPLTFSGPCKSNITVQVSGSLEASDDISNYKKDIRHWIVFDNVQNLRVEGGGTVNGNGKIWWQNSCKVKKSNPCKYAPTALTFYKNKNLVVKDLNIKDAQKMQVSFEKCKNVEVSNLKVSAPEDSPNTDGIHITNTQNIRVTSSTIATGDDCISIVSGSQNVVVEDVTCGPGHGISIGSLGSGNSKEYVSGVTVDGAKFSGTTNGVRIKTWQGGSGYASNIKFQNIEMDNVENPIIIDQYYCDQDKPCKEKGIVLENVNLSLAEEDEAKALCNNVKFNQIEDVLPQCPKNQKD